MQTTLLAVAIAIILALVAALVGPLFIDWGSYRTLFETEASQLLGLDVRVKGEIDARLLPSPRLTLHDVEIGQAGSDNVRAKELNIEFALGPLMRGQWQATDLYLAAPRLSLTLNKSGHILAPKLSLRFNPDVLSVNRLHFDGGTVKLKDAVNGVTATLDHVAFDGRANSLLGPFNGEGSATIGKEYYSVRLAAGRYSKAKGMTLRLSVQPSDHPVSLSVDGTFKVTGGKPHFDGSLSLRRPVGLARAVGQVSLPWHARGHVTASPASALMKDFEFHYGSQERGIKLGGVVEFVFGRSPHLKAELSGNEIDLDHALNGPHDGDRSPGVALRRLARLAAKAFRPPLPLQIGIGIEQVTLAGGVLQEVRGDIAADRNGWNLNSLEFRAPGFTQARLSGQLTLHDKSVRFSGPAVIDATDPKALAAWLEGRAAPKHDGLHPLHLKGDLTLGSEKIAVDDLVARFADKTISGHFDYSFQRPGHPSKFVAALNAPELDLDVALGFGKAVLAGSSLGRPHDMAITADIGRATIAGIEGHGISARMNVDADHWRIDRLAVADLGGAAFSAEGALELAGRAPQGTINVDFEAPQAGPMMTLLRHFAPKTAAALADSAPAMAPAKLHAQLTLGGNVPAGEARLSIDGKLGEVKLTLDGQSQIDAKTLRFGDLHLTGKLSTDDSKALVHLLGLDPELAVGDGPGRLTLAASGPARGRLTLAAKLTADGLEAEVNGNAQPFAKQPTATLRAHVARANAAPLRGIGGGSPLPVSFAGRIALKGKSLSLSDITGNVAGSAVRGHLDVTLAAPHHVAGEIVADSVSGPDLIAAAIGMPGAVTPKGAAWAWSEDPFGAGAFGDFDGKIALKLRKVELLPHILAREFRATLRPGNNTMTLADMQGVVAGGELSGSLTLQSGDDGVSAKGKVVLAGADAATLLQAPARPPISGALGLTLDLQGAGLSPVALIGSLHGSGTITLNHGEVAGLDPQAFDLVTHAVDQGLAVDAHRISEVVRRALDSGQISVLQAKGAISVDAGQLHLHKVKADSTDAALSVSGDLDLIDGTLGAHLVLSGNSQIGGVRPDIYMALQGPLPAPQRSIDVSALTGWLTLRAVAIQAKRVHELEQAKRKQEEAERKAIEAARKRAAQEQALEEAARKQREAAEQLQQQQKQQPGTSSTSPHSAPSSAPVPRQMPKGTSKGTSKGRQSLTSPAPRSRKAPAGMPRNRRSQDQPALRAPLQLEPNARDAQVPALPAPVEVSPLPAPTGAASVRPQN